MIITSSIVEYHPPRLAKEFIKFLKQKNLRFKVNESGTQSIYFQVYGEGSQVRIRFATHGIPTYKDPRIQQFRQVDLSVDPSSGKTFQDAVNLVEGLVA